MAPKSPNNAKAADSKSGRPGSMSDKLEREEAARAYRKVMAGEKLSRAEQAALRRFEKDKEETLRWQYYKTIPQKHWREMCGRQTKVLNEQAARYGIPFGGPTINLSEVARALHDFLADNALKLSRDDDPLMSGSGSVALERYREERAAIARLDRMEREGSLLPRDEVREAMGRVASMIRGAGDALQRHFGQTAVEILTDALDDAEREILRTFADDAPAAEEDL